MGIITYKQEAKDMQSKKIKETSQQLQEMYQFITTKYYEVEEFALCILLSLISRTNMIALGQPGIAKSAILREVVDMIDFSNTSGTPYFHVQMGADISPSNVLGAPDIEHYKKHGIIKRAYEGFLPDAIVAFCSEFYRVNDQVANSGLLTILNEGEFKNGTEVIPTKLRFFMADTNFFPKQADDLDVEESDLRLQALHDRFLSRVLVKPLSDDENKVKMILMDDTYASSVRIPMEDIILLQDTLDSITIPDQVALYMVHIANELHNKHHIFISPRRLKLSRNLVRAHAILNQRTKCTIEDLIALQFAFWQKEEDIIKTKDLIYDTIGIPQKDAHEYTHIMNSILDEMASSIENKQVLPNYDPDPIFEQALSDLTKLAERILEKYSHIEDYTTVRKVYDEVMDKIKEITVERHVL